MELKEVCEFQCPDDVLAAEELLRAAAAVVIVVSADCLNELLID